jgi:hypothetical protein
MNKRVLLGILLVLALTLVLVGTASAQASPITVTFHVHTGTAPGTGQAGYRVHVYNPGGGEVAWRDTDGSGDALFTLNDGASYEYAVEKNGSYSARQSFNASEGLTVNHRLAVVTINVEDSEAGGHDGYRVHVYRSGGGGGGEWAWQDSAGGGVTTFYMVDGAYSYKVEKNGAYGSAQDFILAYEANGYDADEIYRLSQVIIAVKDGGDVGHDGYRVHVYRSDGGGGGEWAWQDSAGGGVTTFYMVDGSYSYKVEKNGSYGNPRDFNLSYNTSNYDLSATYRLSEVTVTIGDNHSGVHAGYRVHIYRNSDGGGGEWAWQDSDASGLTTFYMVDGAYSYKVEKNGTYSGARNFTLTYDDSNYNFGETYILSMVTIRVTNKAGQALQGYRVHVYRSGGGGGGEWAWQDSDASGLTTFYMVDGSYSYKVEKGCYWSSAVDFAADYSQDLALTHKATTTVNIHVTDSAGGDHQGYRVYLYNAGAGSHFAYQDSDANGMTSFELDALKDYEYLVSWGRSSQRVAFSTCGDATLDYNLAKVDITVAGGGTANYRVYVYSDGSGSHFTYQDLAAGGTATFYLVDGDYEYLVAWGRSSQRVDLTVTRSIDGPVVTASDLSLTYNLAKVDITVAGGGAANYRVYVYSDGSGSHFTYQDLAAGDTATFYLVDGDYEYLVAWGRSSQRVDLTVTRSIAGPVVTASDLPLTYNLAKITVKVVNKNNQPQSSFRVYVYSDGSGSHFTYQDTPAASEATFYLVDGAYEYRVVKNCYDSGRVDFGVNVPPPAHDQTFIHKATYNVTIKVSDNDGLGHQGYLVRIYETGGSQVAYQWSDASGMTAFELDAFGSYEYLVEKNGAQSAKKPISTQLCGATALEYRLAKVAVHVSDNAVNDHPGYLVRVYNGTDGSGSQWGYAWTDSNGEATFYLIEGDYGYLIEKNGAIGAKYGFGVAPPAPSADDQTLTYKLAKIVVQVSDNTSDAHQGYLVRVYNDGAAEWGYQWSDANGESTFYLIEGAYEYLVENNGAQSQKYDFTAAPPNPSSDDQTLTYKLAKITVHASDNAVNDHSGYLVRVYNGTDGSGSQWGYAWTDSNGEATFYLIEGDYGYLIEKNGAQSQKYGFTVDAPDISTGADDQTFIYNLTIVDVLASSGQLVRIYNMPSGSQWGYQWSDGTKATFYLIEGDYKYVVEEGGATVAEEEFTVDPPGLSTGYLLLNESGVTVTVVEADGTPVAGATVNIYDPGQVGGATRTTDATGTVTYNPWPRGSDGDFIIGAIVNPGLEDRQTVNVNGGCGSVTLHLTPVTIQVRENDGSSTPVSDATVNLFAPGQIGGKTQVTPDSGDVLYWLPTQYHYADGIHKVGVDKGTGTRAYETFTVSDSPVTVYMTEVTVNVVNPSGDPVSGATVDLYAPTGKYSGTTLTTGDEGTVSYWVADGTYRVEVVKGAVSEFSPYFDVPGTTVVTVDPPDGSYFGTRDVTIDIKPGGGNSINLGSSGVIPVAILSSDTFDATQVDPSTVTLAGAGVAVRGKGNKYLASEEDVNGDGRLDLVVHVETENLNPEEFQSGYAILTGSTYAVPTSSIFVGVPIQGRDIIIVVPPG